MIQKNFSKKSRDISKNIVTEIRTASNTVSYNQQLAKELHKKISKKIKRSNVQETFKENIWSADMTEMNLDKSYRYVIAIIKNVYTDKLEKQLIDAIKHIEQSK